MSPSPAKTAKYVQVCEEHVHSLQSQGEKPIDWMSENTVKMFSDLLVEKGYNTKQCIQYARKYVNDNKPTVVPETVVDLGDLGLNDEDLKGVGECLDNMGKQDVDKQDVSADTNNDTHMSSGDDDDDSPKPNNVDHIMDFVNQKLKDTATKLATRTYIFQGDEHETKLSEVEMYWILTKTFQKITGDLNKKHSSLLQSHGLSRKKSQKLLSLDEFQQSHDGLNDASREQARCTNAYDFDGMKAAMEKMQTIMANIPAEYEAYKKEFESTQQDKEEVDPRCLQPALPRSTQKRSPGPRKYRKRKSPGSDGEDEDKVPTAVDHLSMQKVKEYSEKDGDAWVSTDNVRALDATLQKEYRRLPPGCKLGVNGATKVPCDCIGCKTDPSQQGRYVDRAHHCESYCVHSKVVIAWKDQNNELRTDFSVPIVDFYTNRKQHNGPNLFLSHVDPEMVKDMKESWNDNCKTKCPPQLTLMHLCQYLGLGHIMEKNEKNDECHLAVFGYPVVENEEGDAFSFYGSAFVVMPLIHVNASVVTAMRDGMGMEMLTTIVPSMRLNRAKLEALFGNKDNITYGASYSIFTPDPRGKQNILEKFDKRNYYSMEGFPSKSECQSMTIRDLKTLDNHTEAKLLGVN